MTEQRGSKVNFIEFSFLDHRSALNPLLLTNSRHQHSYVDNVQDFWKFVGKYESMLRGMGKPVLPELLSESEYMKPQPYHKGKHLAIQLMSNMLRDDKSVALLKQTIAQFRQLLLIYLDFKQKEKFNRIKKLRQTQQALPIARFKRELRTALDATRVLIIAGDTGCGKSTQVPQFLYEFGYRSIACTQPRRLACVSLSKRVAHELLDDYGSKVGFQIRFERSKTQFTNIVFITEGLLLRQLAVSTNLEQYDALILDEIHERNLFGDFLLGITKCLLRAKPQLKLILMSATINVELFHNYFKQEGAQLLQVPGRLFPIKLKYMPPPTLELKSVQTGASKRTQRGNRLDPAPFIQVLSLIDQQYPITERGDVLIFVSGVNEITIVCDAIAEYAAQQAHWLVLPLHSGLALAEQDKVFDDAPDGTRKCIVSTNIAETSLTVDGVRFVIDSGKVKEMSYDTVCKGQRLKEFWVSKSSADQRKGRAGRIGPGVCFRLFTQQQYDDFDAYPAPEIYRVPLDTILLQMVSMGLPNVRQFPFIEAPDAESIEQTILALKQHCALTVDEKITPLGVSLANLPVELSIGKMLLMGCVFPDVEQLLTLAAMLSVQNPFTNRAYTDPKCERTRQALETDQGDLFTLLRCYHEWLQLKMQQDNTRKWCHNLGIEEQRFYEVSKLRQQFQNILSDCKMAPSSSSANATLLSSAERARRHGELRQLKALKRQQKFEQPRQRKMLKRHGAQLDANDFEQQPGQDIRDVDFRLRHDARQMVLLARSAHVERRSDVVLLKLLLVSGFYPQLAIADEFNYCKGGTQQFFHTKLKAYICLHPNSYFAKNYELLNLSESDFQAKPEYYTPKQPLSERHQLLCFQSLLETAKPYLMNCIRMPAAQTLLLFSFAIDTNAIVTRIVCDAWLALDFPVPESGLELLCRAIKLRRRWNSQLYTKLHELNTEHTPDQTSSSCQADQQLWHDLVDYMNANVTYSIKRLLPADLKTLYTHTAPRQLLQTNPFAADYAMSENSLKGGLNVCEHVVYGCLTEQNWTLAMETALLAHNWHCKHCDFELNELDVIQKLLHRQQCQERQSKPAVPQPQSSSAQAGKNSHYCKKCGRHLQLSQVDMLRHKRQCVQ